MWTNRRVGRRLHRAGVDRSVYPHSERSRITRSLLIAVRWVPNDPEPCTAYECAKR